MSIYVVLQKLLGFICLFSFVLFKTRFLAFQRFILNYAATNYMLLLTDLQLKFFYSSVIPKLYEQKAHVKS